MSAKKKAFTVIIGGLIIAGSLTGCIGKSQDMKDREALQSQSSKNGDSLELKNLKEKRKREENPSSIRYLYVMNFGKIVGYYVTKGKISSNGSQIAPEQDILYPYSTSDGYIVDSAQDDGSYGAGDPGIFFFTTDGVMVVTSLDYIQSDSPLAVDVPRLGGTTK
jgi:hypothetical protein